jgi:hypothetical protein
MDELKKVLDLMPEAKRSLGLAAKERQGTLKKLRQKIEDEGFDPKPVDDELELLKGTKEKRGLFYALDVQEEQKAKPEKAKDPLQADLEDAKDYRTWNLTTEQVAELVSAEISANPAAAAIRILNALEDGENEKVAGARKSVLDVIRAARKPLVAKVDAGGLAKGAN